MPDGGGDGGEPLAVAHLLSELEDKYFWWEPVSAVPRSPERILAQAMDLACFADIARMERIIGVRRLLGIMRGAQPGWFSERSWELWRGRLARATGDVIPEEPPRRALHAETV